MRTIADGNEQPASPLGAPVNRPAPPDPQGQWVKTDNPHIERNTATGMMRNVKPAPPPAPQYPWFGISAGKPTP